MSKPATDTPTEMAAEVFAAQAAARQIAPFSDRRADLDLDLAYAAAAELQRMRAERGDRAVGRKIGFTNRSLWAPYNVDAPIWGYMYRSTVHELGDVEGTFSLAHLSECQIEPEIVFKLSRAPEADGDLRDLLDCIAWCAHGFEIVTSLYPGWRFNAADAVACGGLHGALLIGAPMTIDAAAHAKWLRELETFDLALLRGDEIIDRGSGANVLDHPLAALRHLIALLAQDRHNPPLAAGEIVTTGSVTRAFRIAPGERWQTRIQGIPLSGLSLSLR